MLSHNTFIERIRIFQLILLHTLVIGITNAIVPYPLKVYEIDIGWSVFTIPLILLSVMVSTKLHGTEIPSKAIYMTYPLAILATLLVLVFDQVPPNLMLRLALASCTAYLISTLLSIQIFNCANKQWKKQWSIAPIVTIVIASILDTFLFWGGAFYQSADPYLAANWVSIACNKAIVKSIIGIVVFVPIYGLLVNKIYNVDHK